MKIIFSPECLEYKSEGHPESPERVSETYDFLKNSFDFARPEQARERDVLLAHTKNLLDKVKNNKIYELDTPNIPNIFSYALLSAGAAIKTSQLALKGKNAFSLMRPPGHHAGKDFLGGFCYFNNIAISILKSLNSVNRAVVIDFDCHHGNGTQDIFMGNKKILYISLHQHPLFPGTGLVSEKNCINYPLTPGIGENLYLKIFRKAIEIVKKYNPDLIGVSAGFDTYKEDPLTNINLEKRTYEKIGRIISELGKPIFSVLEGGYAERLPECVFQYLKGLE